MSIRTRVIQDRRGLSRVTALFPCTFTFEQDTYKAVVVDLSLKGVLLSSGFLPPVGRCVRVSLQNPSTNAPIELSGTVVRGGWCETEDGSRGRFGVHFRSTPSELLPVLRSLMSKREEEKPPSPVPSR